MMRHYHLMIALELLTTTTLDRIIDDLALKREELWIRVRTGPSDPDTDRAITEELIELDEELLKLRLERAWRT